MALVMISYARSDEAHVQRVAGALRAAGHEVWWDDALDPSAPWDALIEQTIAKADAVVTLWTPTSVEREWVRLEAHAAKEQGKLVPLMVEPSKPPLSFRLVQTLELFDWDGDPDDTRWQRALAWIGKFASLDPCDANQLGSAATKEVSPAFSETIRQRMDTLNRTVDRLTDEQFDVLRMLGTTRRVRIAGCAGSGKTLVACEKALRCSRAGLRVLFLCHSRYLADHVAEMIGAEGVLVSDFSSWLSSVLGLEQTPLSERWINIDEPDETTLERAFERVLETQGFDAIIVDEGQDFRETWWLLVEAALASPDASQLYIFHDDNQALLPFRAEYPFEDPILSLSRNCRNAGRVFEAVRTFHPQAPSTDKALDGQGFLARFRAESADLDTAVDHAVRTMEEQGQFAGRRVLLLAGGLEKTDLVDRPLVLMGEADEHWRDTVRRYLEKAVTTFVRRGIVTSQDDALRKLQALDGLSSNPIPTEADVALVRDVAQSIEIDRQDIKRLSGGSEDRLALKWRLEDGALRFRRTLGGRLHGVEILLFFSSPDWADGKPATRRWSFAPQDVDPGTFADSIEVHDISAFKGLEADSVVILVGHHQPMPSAKLYVALSRARSSAALVDCSDGLSRYEPLRKVTFDLRESHDYLENT